MKAYGFETARHIPDDDGAVGRKATSPVRDKTVANKRRYARLARIAGKSACRQE